MAVIAKHSTTNLRSNQPEQGCGTRTQFDVCLLSSSTSLQVDMSGHAVLSHPYHQHLARLFTQLGSFAICRVGNEAGHTLTWHSQAILQQLPASKNCSRECCSCQTLVVVGLQIEQQACKQFWVTVAPNASQVVVVQEADSDAACLRTTASALTVVTPSPWQRRPGGAAYALKHIKQPVSSFLLHKKPGSTSVRQLSILLPHRLPAAQCEMVKNITATISNLEDFRIVFITNSLRLSRCNLAAGIQSSRTTWQVHPSEREIADQLHNSLALLHLGIYDSHLGPVEGISLAVGTPVLVLPAGEQTDETVDDADRWAGSTALVPVSQMTTLRNASHAVQLIRKLAGNNVPAWVDSDPRYDSDFIRLQWAHLLQLPTLLVPSAALHVAPYDANLCRMATCFNWLRCTRGFSLYVEPLYEPVAAWTSRLVEIWRSLEASPYRVHDEAHACVTFAAVDFFNHRYYNGDGWHNLDRSKQRPLWRNGVNNLIWAPHDDPFAGDFDQAMILRASTSSNFRHGFDIAIPMYMGDAPSPAMRNLGKRKYLACFKGARYNREGAHVRNALRSLHNGQDIIVLSKCSHNDGWPPRFGAACAEDEAKYDTVSYDEMLQECVFTLAPRGAGTFSYRVFEAMAHASIPIILSDTYRPPFEELIDWSSVALHLPKDSVAFIPAILRQMPADRIASMQHAGLAVWEKYLKNYPTIVNTAVSILAARVEGPENPHRPPATAP